MTKQVKRKKVLRCMAYKEGDVYVAVCLSLSLSAQADDILSAMDKLENQICDYLDEAISEPEYLVSLLNRPAPLSMWAKYYFIKWVQIIRGNSNNTSIYEESCPA